MGVIGSAGCAEQGLEPRADRGPEGSTSACPVLTVSGECRALAADDVVTVASGDLFSPGPAFVTKDGGFQAFAVGYRSQRVVEARSDRAWQFDQAEPLPWSNARAATGAVLDGGDLLYFVGSAGSELGLRMSRVSAAGPKAPVPVVLDGFNGLPSWPQAVGLPGGRVLLAFVEPHSRVMVGVDDGTGASFAIHELPIPQQDRQGVLAHVGVTTAGSWVVTYQVSDPQWHFRSFVVMSRDGGTFSAPVAVGTSSDDDVSDAFPIQRGTGGADIYYVKRETRRSTTSFTQRNRVDSTVRRRALHEDGTLGPEQVVSSDDVGDVSKPQPRRLPQGYVALMLSIQRSDDARDLAFAHLDGDAPY